MSEMKINDELELMNDFFFFLSYFLLFLWFLITKKKLLLFALKIKKPLNRIINAILFN